jgi:hypothetical protein
MPIPVPECEIFPPFRWSAVIRLILASFGVCKFAVSLLCLAQTAELLFVTADGGGDGIQRGAEVGDFGGKAR